MSGVHMTKLKTIRTFLMSVTVAAAAMYVIGWRSIAGILGASIAAALAIVLVTRRSD